MEIVPEVARPAMVVDAHARALERIKSNKRWDVTTKPPFSKTPMPGLAKMAGHAEQIMLEMQLQRLRLPQSPRVGVI